MKVYLLCALVVASTVVAVIGDSCPAELVRPCRCEGSSVVCSNFNSTAELQAVFDNSVDYPFDKFTIEYSNFLCLLSSWVIKKNIMRLTIKNTSLTALFDQIPSSNNKLRHLYLYDVRLMRGIQWEHLKPFDFDSIIIKGMKIKKIGKSFANNMAKTLSAILFDGTNTKYLDDNVFQNFRNLFLIEIKNAQLTTLKRSMFPDPCLISEINFSNNLIESLPDDVFSNMNRMKEVYLSGNKLVTLSEAVFKKVYTTPRAKLEVDGNPLICDCHISWMVASKPSAIVKGSCSAPSTLKDRELSTLKKEDFQYCS